MSQKLESISKVRLYLPPFSFLNSLIHITTEAIIYNRNKDQQGPTGQWFNELLSTTPWFSSVVPNFHILPPSSLPSFADSATQFTSVCINTAVYLPYLVSQCLLHGVVLKRTVLSHISSAVQLHASGQPADIVVNCTGLLASKLGGVMDKSVIPARGQIVVVRNSPGAMFTVSGTDDGEDEVAYIMERAAGGGTILGGTYQKGSWESQPNPNTAVSIMKRAIELCPSLVKPGQGIEGLSIIRHGVGLRPLREAGVRIEKEKIEGTWVVHNYGHGGWGYQGSYGCSEGVVELVDGIFSPKPKL
jgi:D-amino-acid oxidase